MTLVEELRSKKSRDNRGLLDRAADRIDELEAELKKIGGIFDEIDRRKIDINIERVTFAAIRSDHLAKIKEKYKGGAE